VFMGRSTAFCAESGQFRLQVKIPQNTPQNTRRLTLLFVIQKALHADRLDFAPKTPRLPRLRAFTWTPFYVAISTRGGGRPREIISTSSRETADDAATIGDRSTVLRSDQSPAPTNLALPRTRRNRKLMLSDSHRNEPAERPLSG